MTDSKTIKQTFRSSIRRGTGEAHLIMQNNPTVDFSADIIKASLTNYAYDGQSENSRALYLSELISLSKQRDKIRKAVLHGLATEQDNTWTLTQLFDLAKIFAQSGDTVSRQAIFDRFFNHPVDHSDWVGYSEILELDGLEGLVFIADKIGKALEKNPDDWQDDMIIDHFQRENPKVKAFAELEKASKQNRFIKIYLDNIKRTEENRKNHIREKVEYKNIIEEVLLCKPYIRLWKRKITDKQLTAIANQLLIEKNKNNQEKLLYVFNKFKFPFDSEFILQFAKQKPTSKNRIVEFAIDALQYLQSKEIRQFALDQLKTTKRPESLTSILISNYQNGDSKLLTELAEKFNQDYIIENLASSYIDIYKANKTTECKEPLEAIYDKLTCGIHRKGIIEVLMDNKVLSNKIRQEIKYDSYFETRQLLDRKKNGR